MEANPQTIFAVNEKTLLSRQKLSLVLHFLQLKLDGKKQLEEYKDEDVSRALKDVSYLVWEIRAWYIQSESCGRYGSPK